MLQNDMIARLKSPSGPPNAAIAEGSNEDVSFFKVLASGQFQEPLRELGFRMVLVVSARELRELLRE